MPVNNVSLIPLDWTAQAEDIQRRRALAQAIQQQSMAPIERFSSGGIEAPISWTQGLAKMLQGYVGGKTLESATESEKALNQQIISDRQAKLASALGGADPYQAGADLFASGDPALQGLGGALVTKGLEDRRRKQIMEQLGIGSQNASPGQALAAEAASGGATGPTNAAASRIGQSNSGLMVNPLAAALMMSGDKDLSELGKAQQTAYQERTKPQNVRPEGTIAEFDPVTGQWQQRYYSPKVGQGMTRDASGQASIIPGYQAGQYALGNVPMQQVTNSDQTTSFIPKSAIAAPFAPQQQIPQNLPPVISTVRTPEQQAALRHHQLPNGQWVTKEGNPVAENSAHFTGNAMDIDMRRATPQQVQLLHAGGWQQTNPQGDPNHWEKRGAFPQAPRFGQTQSEQVQQAGETAASKARDEQFSKDYITFSQGGAQDMAKQLAQLQDVSGALSKPNANLTGPILGRLPDTVKSFTNPQSIAMRERVEEVVQRSLRSILGAQFTENEGGRLIARAYNPSLSESENKIRVDRLLTQLSQAFASKKDAADYFAQRGTLTGWKGKLPSISDFNPDSAGSVAVPTGVDPKLWSHMTEQERALWR